MGVTDQILTRRVEKILPSRQGLADLMSERKIRLYQGFDPTGSRLHLGHSIGLRKLMDFANAGHEVIFLFGTGTVLVGDPSQREEARGTITQGEIEENIKTWKEQAQAIVDFSKVTIKQNGDWLLKLNLADIIKIASNISAVQLFKRDMFQRRTKQGDTVWYHETMYPILQGYDSVVMDVDLEVGGTDQEFNMLVGRELMRKMKSKQKYVLTVPMIDGTDGKPMSKTSGNCVWLDDSPGDMFGKLMSVQDDQIVQYLELVTNVPMERVQSIKQGLGSGKIHPMDAKKELAVAVVTDFHGAELATGAKEEFEEVFQKGGVPEESPTYQPKSDSINLVEVLTETGLAKSNSEARRLLEQGAVEWNGKKVEKPELTVNSSGTLKVGKYRFLRIQQTTKG